MWQDTRNRPTTQNDFFSCHYIKATFQSSRLSSQKLKHNIILWSLFHTPCCINVYALSVTATDCWTIHVHVHEIIKKWGCYAHGHTSLARVMNLRQHRHLLGSHRWDQPAWIWHWWGLSLPYGWAAIAPPASHNPTCPHLAREESRYKHHHSSQLQKGSMREGRGNRGERGERERERERVSEWVSEWERGA